MAGVLPRVRSQHSMMESSPYGFSYDELEESVHSSSNWYMSRKEIEENSPSRRDGIDLKKESFFRKSYCTFLQDLGMRLKVPQVTIATAIIFCHRFFLRQSHAKNDRKTIATVCMFLAGKVEETPRPLKDVILVSYEINHKKDPAAVQRIKQKEVYEQQKELILLGERMVLTTLGFDLNVHHPYKPLVEAIKKFKVAQNALAQVAWNFVNDGLRTSLCLQFKPHHIAAGAIFLAAKFLKVKLPSDGEKVWWQEFDVTPRQLEDVSNQMLELYEQNTTVPPSHGDEVDGSGAHQTPLSKASPVTEGTATVKLGRLMPDQFFDTQHRSQRSMQNMAGDFGGNAGTAGNREHQGDSSMKDAVHCGPNSCSRDAIAEASSSWSKNGLEKPLENPERHNRVDSVEPKGLKDDGSTYKSCVGGQNYVFIESSKGHHPQDSIGKIYREKVRATLEKRRKSQSDVSRNTDVMDEYDIIERELENGVELAAEDEKTKSERKQKLSKPLYKTEHDNQKLGKVHGALGEENALYYEARGGSMRHTQEDTVGTDNVLYPDEDNAEEGELYSPNPGNRKMVAVSPQKLYDGRQVDYMEHKRQRHEAHM